MNYTETYRLPQWEKSDRILMDDFNQAMSDIEDGLTAAVSHGDAAASAAESSATAVANAAGAAASQAQSTANAALSRANAAYSPSFAPYAAGTYSGNGSSQVINVGFRPSFVIVTVVSGSIAGLDNMAMTGGGSTKGVQIASSGFQVTFYDGHTSPVVNAPNGTYGYIAFR